MIPGLVLRKETAFQPARGVDSVSDLTKSAGGTGLLIFGLVILGIFAVATYEIGKATVKSVTR